MITLSRRGIVSVQIFILWALKALICPFWLKSLLSSGTLQRLHSAQELKWMRVFSWAPGMLVSLPFIMHCVYGLSICPILVNRISQEHLVGNSISLAKNINLDSKMNWFWWWKVIVTLGPLLYVTPPPPFLSRFSYPYIIKGKIITDLRSVPFLWTRDLRKALREFLWRKCWLGPED